MKLSKEDIIDALLHLDDNTLTEEHMQKLIKMCPEPEEE